MLWIKLHELIDGAGLAEGFAEYIDQLNPLQIPLFISPSHKGVRRIAGWGLSQNEKIDPEA